MLNKAKDYYKNNKKRLRGQARDKYRNLSEEKMKRKNMDQSLNLINRMVF